MSDLVKNVTSKFSQLFQLQPTIFRAPGRINLIGEHTDYNDGFVMPAAIDKAIYFAIAPAPDGITTIYSLDMDSTVTVNLNRIERIAEAHHWANYLYGVLARLQENGSTIRPFKCVFGGDIPVGSGLSSSAALECGFIYALNTIYDLSIPKVDMVKMAQWAEHNFAGVKCGIMDQFSSMMGKDEHVFMLDCRSLEYTYFPLKLNEYEILLLDSNVKHSLASSEYNTRRKECEDGVAILKKTYPGITNLRDVKPETVLKHKDELPGKVFDRCLYVTQEIVRVPAAGKDLENGNLAAFGQKMYETHEGLSKLYEVSCPELDFLVNFTKDNPDVLGSRVMGGGFGGCTINIVKSSAVDALVANAREAYKKAFGIEMKVHKVKTKDGVSKISEKQ